MNLQTNVEDAHPVPAIDFEKPENAFLLGCVVAGEKERLSEAEDREYLRAFREGSRDGSADEYIVDWPIDAGQSVVVHGVGPTAIVIPPECERAFVQGFLSGASILRVTEQGEPHVRLAHKKTPYLPYALSVIGLSMPEAEGFFGVAALDAVGRLLSDAPGAVPRVRAFFEQFRTRVSRLNEAEVRNESIRVQLVHPEARLPKKEHVSDSGYDLTLLYEKKRLGKTILYGTGVIIEPPFGWYFDVVPRSSIIKHGYILANSVGVIDRSYRGEIFVPLIKIDESATDLELPARLVQLIPRPIVHFPVELRTSLTSTTRGSGGFGSTGK